MCSGIVTVLVKCVRVPNFNGEGLRQLQHSHNHSFQSNSQKQHSLALALPLGTAVSARLRRDGKTQILTAAHVLFGRRCSSAFDCFNAFCLVPCPIYLSRSLSLSLSLSLNSEATEEDGGMTRCLPCFADCLACSMQARRGAFVHRSEA